MKKIDIPLFIEGKNNTKKPSHRGKMFGYQVLGFGSGSEKTKELIKNPNFKTLNGPQEPSAKSMVKLSYKKFENKDFEDVAYFEPYYLKEFYTAKA